MTKSLALSIVIEQFTSLSAQANAEAQAMRALAAGSNPLLNLLDLMRSSQFSEKAPLNVALRRFLKDLPENQLHALFALAR